MPFSFQVSDPADATPPYGVAVAASTPNGHRPMAGWRRDLTPNAAPASGALSSLQDAGAATDCWIEDCEETATHDGFCDWHAKDFKAFKAHLFGGAVIKLERPRS